MPYPPLVVSILTLSTMRHGFATTVPHLPRRQSGRVSPVAIVTGASGQDGFYLTERVLGEGFRVRATVHTTVGGDELRGIKGSEGLTPHTVDLRAPRVLGALIAEIRPDEFYNLAGQSSDDMLDG